MKRPVRSQRVASISPARAGEVGEATAGLLDDDLRGGEVPERGRGLAHDVGGALGQQHVGPEIAEPPRAPASFDEGQDLLEGDGAVPVLKAGDAQVGIGEIVDGGDVERAWRTGKALIDGTPRPREPPTSGDGAPAPMPPRG